MEQMDKVSYATSFFYTTDSVEDLAAELIDSTGGKMARAVLVSSGSEAMEAAIKMARQYFLELPVPQPQRDQFIARRQSYHGATLGALAMVFTLIYIFSLIRLWQSGLRRGLPLTPEGVPKGRYVLEAHPL